MVKLQLHISGYRTHTHYLKKKFRLSYENFFIVLFERNDTDVIKLYNSKIFVKGRTAGVDLEEAKLCPNCARQGQIFPNVSKRNQK